MLPKSSFKSTLRGKFEAFRSLRSVYICLCYDCIAGIKMFAVQSRLEIRNRYSLLDAENRQMGQKVFFYYYLPIAREATV